MLQTVQEPWASSLLLGSLALECRSIWTRTAQICITQLLKAPLWLQMHKCHPSSIYDGSRNFSATETTIAPASMAKSPLSVPSTSSSSVSQADATSTLPESSSATSASTANTLATNNGCNTNNNSGSDTSSTSGSSP
ncbi:hypothetical protein K435DRAFT_966912 [Dendrothele bispora CBS 962.96]|uniref:Uncharacterized protein n=1 Tax=Dendrothele bispora (strain CBS 962.96) TaxID=1314807 RepID=A0A4S8LX92_DENBC|nr:hypothetical protein K435DRAFT_966912 [Dendrothele bispora CBS 962.96]